MMSRFIGVTVCVLACLLSGCAAMQATHPSGRPWGPDQAECSSQNRVRVCRQTDQVSNTECQTVFGQTQCRTVTTPSRTVCSMQEDRPAFRACMIRKGWHLPPLFI